MSELESLSNSEAITGDMNPVNARQHLEDIIPIKQVMTTLIPIIYP